MKLFSKGGSLWRNTISKGRIDRELTEEVGSFVELLTEKKMKQGLNETEARREAMLEVGGVEQVKEEVRAGRTGFALETFFQDLRYGFRSLRKKPGFTLTAVVALALGIGANSAIFSVINGVLLRSLAYQDSDKIVMVWERSLRSNRSQNVVSPANFLDWKKQATSFEHFAACWDTRVNVTSGGEPEEIQVQRVSADFFSVLGVAPNLGRSFRREEDVSGAISPVVLSYELWQSRFGGNPGILGQPVTMSGRTMNVIGVMPPGFHFLNNQVKAWIPLALDPAKDWRKSGRFLRSVARLKPGRTAQQAQAELDAIARQLETAYPAYNKSWGANVVPMHEQIVGDIRPVLLVLLAAVAFVLLIACANVANLLLSRAAARQKELALRAALGAGRLRLIRQMLTESVLLALMGGALGLVLAYWGIRVLVAFAPDNLPRLNEITIDPRVLAFTFGVSLVTGVAFGLVPALQSSRPDLNDALKEGARGSSSGNRLVRNLFVVTEMALALVLLVGAGLMLRSFFQLNQVKTGFATENVLTLRVQLPMAKYPEPQQRAEFFKRAEERLQTLPGVKSVGAISYLPLTGLASSTAFNLASQPELPPSESPGTEVRAITPGYFKAMGIPLLKGRAFDERDGADSRVLIINETLGRKYFAGQDPIGQRLIISWDPKVTDEIIGVVGDTKETALEQESNAAIYWPHPREPYQFMTFILRAGTDPALLSAAVAKEIHGLDPDQPIADVRTLEQVVAKSIARPRFNTLLLAIFAGVALVLASVGIYGVMSYSATQRTQEIGIRMALGANPRDILRLVVGHGMKLTVAGIVLGLIASLALTRLMTNLLFGVTVTDLPTFLGVSAVLALVALLANYIPARRATRINPVLALRYE
ncbi:MAG TPA: ABC transporter permease [Chthoniobacterales bacterium]|nr:ABC transporter permease [Chthoniobacterales bacterium]